MLFWEDDMKCLSNALEYYRVPFRNFIAHDNSTSLDNFWKIHHNGTFSVKDISKK